MEDIELARGGFLVRKVFEVLMDHPGGLPPEAILAELQVRFDLAKLNPRDPDVLPTSLDEMMPFQKLGPLKAPWLANDQGLWFLTEEGRTAYWNFLDPREFMQEAMGRDEESSPASNSESKLQFFVKPEPEAPPKEEKNATFHDYETPHWLAPPPSPLPDDLLGISPIEDKEPSAQDTPLPDDLVRISPIEDKEPPAQDTPPVAPTRAEKNATFDDYETPHWLAPPPSPLPDDLLGISPIEDEEPPAQVTSPEVILVEPAKREERIGPADQRKFDRRASTHPREAPSPASRPAAPRWSERPELSAPLTIIRQHKWLIMGFAFFFGVISFLLSTQQAPEYESKASLVLKPQLDAAGRTIDLNLVTEEARVESPKVAERVVKDLGLTDGPGSLLGHIEVDDISDSEILEITYVHQNPRQAQRLAQGFAVAYLEVKSEELLSDQNRAAGAIAHEIQVLTQRLGDLSNQIADAGNSAQGSLQAEANLLTGLIVQRQVDQLKLSNQAVIGEVLLPANRPGRPTKPNKLVNTLFGVVVGAILGAAAPLVRDRLSSRLQTTKEVEAILEAPVLGIVPKIPRRKWRRGAFLASASEGDSSAAESYRILRTNLLSSPSVPRTLLVTSPRLGDGKTSTVANLGVSLANAGYEVIVVSADLRRPRLPAFLRVRKDVGLSEVLKGELSIDDALARTPISRLKLLSPGAIPDVPAELLGSPTMKSLLQSLASRADFVLVDAAPLLAVSDAMVLAPLVDALLIVVGPVSTTGPTLEATREHIENLGANLVGAVLNNVDPPHVSSFSYS